jgi:hypothetical protein
MGIFPNAEHHQLTLNSTAGTRFPHRHLALLGSTVTFIKHYKLNYYFHVLSLTLRLNG